MHSPPPEHPTLPALDPGLLRAVAAGHARLTPEQALDLFNLAPLHTLGRHADARCRALHGNDIRTYIIDRNINYTNICTARCTFCAFRRDAADHDAYTLDPSQIHDKIAELQSIGGTQILMQGGMNPALPLKWYTDLLSGIKSKFPTIHIHAFSPPEFIEFVHFFDPPGDTLEDKIRAVMLPLRQAGLDSIPGGGGEIFADPVRRKIGLGKCDADAWLTCMYVAHTLGMFTSATMMFGHIEGYADRIHHMHMVRKWQDRALGTPTLRGGSALGTPTLRGGSALGTPTLRGGSALGTPTLRGGSALGTPTLRGGSALGTPTLRGGSPSTPRHLDTSTPWGHYKAFISWPFQRENTPLGRVPDWGLDPAELAQEFPGDTIAKSLWRKPEEPALFPPGTRTADAFDYEAIDKSQHPTAHLFGKRVRMSSATDYLRTQALSRLFLDNIYSIGASWVTMGPHIGQVALAYGANDMGSVMMEENVVSSAGTTYCLDQPVLCRLIRDAGFTPAQRNNTYDVINLHAGETTDPDLAVTDWSTHRAKKTHQQAPRPVQPRVTAKPKLATT